MKRLSGARIWLLQIITTSACIVATALMVPLSDVQMALARADTWPVVLTFVLMPFAILSRALRWRFILARQGVRVSRWSSLQNCLIGQAYNLFLPASLGDIARSYHGWQDHGNKEVMFAASLIDKVVALFTLCVIGLVCALILGNREFTTSSAALSVALAVPVLVPGVIPWKFVASLFKKLLGVDMDTELLGRTFQLDAWTLVVTIVYSCVGWLLTNLMYYYAWIAFTPDVTMLYAFAIAPLINLMRTLPVTASGIGSAELLIVFLFSLAGMNESDALMGSLVATLALIILPGLLGCILLAFVSRPRVA